ncbi:MAG TPA: hypothetical protein VMF06_05070 [Candidatus Limnocylindria bacterium]|jgi:hypothetical protein|nr:hypothetical protein [Candidatus Limnocylindria bacterium]
MFRILHRILKLGAVSLLIAGGYLLWDRREQARPLLDYYDVWRVAGYSTPVALPVLEGQVTGMASENAIHFKDARGLKYRIVLAGIDAIIPQNASDAKIRDALRQKIGEQLVGQEGRVCYTMLDATRAGAGFLYLGTNTISYNSEQAAEGNARIPERAMRLLSLREQVYLRNAIRRRSGSLLASGASGG